MDGMQTLLLNEYEPEMKFLKHFKAEEKIREIGVKYPNTYSISLFACCRQKLDSSYDYMPL